MMPYSLDAAPVLVLQETARARIVHCIVTQYPCDSVGSPPREAARRDLHRGRQLDMDVASLCRGA